MSHATITAEEQAAIADYVNTHTIAKGVGTPESACSIAAINLALTGELTDTIPPCMSEVIGRWIIVIQDAMPAYMRNSVEWRRLLPLAAGTGREREQERAALIIDHMWSTTLPTLQPVADKNGFGVEWATMCKKRAADAADAARAARAAAYAAYAADATWQTVNPAKLLSGLINVK